MKLNLSVPDTAHTVDAYHTDTQPQQKASIPSIFFFFFLERAVITHLVMRDRVEGRGL